MIKHRHDAWLHWTITHNCNMLCKYCFYDREHVKYNDLLKKINIPGLIKTLEKTGKIFRIGFTGGEPFLIPNIIEACQELTRKHVLSFNTNTISKKIIDFANTINPECVFEFVCSLHIKELERLNLLDRFIYHVQTLKEKDFDIKVKEIAYPPLINEIDKYKKIFSDKGINISFDYFVGNWNGKKYPQSYTEHEIKRFELDKIPNFNKKHYYKKGQPCNAGYNAGFIEPDGRIKICSQVKKTIGNIYTEINFYNKMIRCPVHQCECPLSSYDPILFKKALTNMNTEQKAKKNEHYRIDTLNKKKDKPGNNIKRKAYDTWLFWCISDLCNLRCVYCSGDPLKYGKDGLPEEINIPALIKTLSETNRVFRIGFTGGEPFLIPNIIPAFKEITKNHYISIITNLTSLKIDDFAKEINPDRVMSILASTHIKELERNKLMDRFISNFLICEKRGFNISAVEIAYPPYITEIQKYKDFFRKKGITLQFDPFKGNNKGKEYPESYTEEEIKAFGITLRPDSYTTMVHKGCICNAGYNAGIVTPAGDIQICFESKKTIGNVYNRIEFRKTLITCPFEYCQCPLKYYDPYLFQKAMADFRNPV